MHCAVIPQLTSPAASAEILLGHEDSLVASTSGGGLRVVVGRNSEGPVDDEVVGLGHGRPYSGICGHTRGGVWDVGCGCGSGRVVWYVFAL